MVPHNNKYWKVTVCFWGLWGISALPFAHLLPEGQTDAKHEGEGSFPVNTTGDRALCLHSMASLTHLDQWSLWHIQACWKSYEAQYVGQNDL